MYKSTDKKLDQLTNEVRVLEVKVKELIEMVEMLSFKTEVSQYALFGHTQTISTHNINTENEEEI